MQSTAVKEKLSTQQLCERRNEIVTLITKAVETLSEADTLLKTLCMFGFTFERHTFYSPSEAENKLKTIADLTKQVDSKIWNHIVELGQFRELMTIKEQRKISEALESCPPVTIENVTATLSELLANRPNMLKDLVETAFLERSSGYRSNAGNKINKKQVIDGVFCRYGFTNFGSRPCDRLEDLTKAVAILVGMEKPHITNILSKEREHIAFEGKVKYVAYKNGNVHVTILDKVLLDKLNDVLAGAMGAKIGGQA
ncbi:DUF4942 domain-containing protein [Vibrio cholerae]